MPQHTPEPLPSPLAHRIESVMRLTGASRTRIYAALKAGELEAVKIALPKKSQLLRKKEDWAEILSRKLTDVSVSSPLFLSLSSSF